LKFATGSPIEVEVVITQNTVPVPPVSVTDNSTQYLPSVNTTGVKSSTISLTSIPKLFPITACEEGVNPNSDPISVPGNPALLS
jgi:hypothetical protein